MRRIEIFSIFTVCLVLLGCEPYGVSHKANSDFAVGKVHGTDRDRVAPLRLLKIFEQEYIEHYKVNHPADSKTSDASIKSNITKKHLVFDVKVWSQYTGVLRANTRYHLARGGGEIDFADLVIGKLGLFHVAVTNRKTPEISEGVSFTKVMFLSGTPKRIVAGKSLGAGCNMLLDVTELFNEKMRGGGFQLEIKNQQYLSYVGGIFFLLYLDGDHFNIGTISFTDSRWPKSTCGPRSS